MPLIACPACGKQVSDQAPGCPSCGHPIAGPPPGQAPQKVIIEQPPPQRSGGGGCIIFLVLLVIAGIAAAATKPGELGMKKAIVAKHGAGFGFAAAFGEAIGTAKSTYHDYLVFSTLTMKDLRGTERTLAIGLFGQVIVLDL